MKIVFMGTPDFAASALEALLKAGHEIVGVVTQPDKPKGRSGELQYSPVKKCALQYQIPMFQPVRIKEKEPVAELKKMNADVFVVVAFGQILSKEILDMPPLGCLNIHASLLPKLRGASPIQHAIFEGEEKTGITIIQMDLGIDTGDMLYQYEVMIDKKDNFESLHDKLMEAGGIAIVETLSLLEQGKIVPKKQIEEESTYASKIEKNMGEIDFTLDAATIERKIRGMNPWPSAYTFYRGKQMKIWEAEVVEEDCNSEPGSIIQLGKDYILVAAGKGLIKIKNLQLEGKKRMDVRDFLLGVNMEINDKFEQSGNKDR